ncbi:hypothetical protein PHYSODRAFT_299880 [Phytophthora sojae]|uniref:Uncharacterized protein n=1 Tax=Phytophthora sojae (strain P6497) TaxID=1094619 RepID=G4ZBD7_PHYSP|nr:hypothetical protein PHYSODRAFT_299880 [Phytophthora sojae]EGZ22733.1 hypothetical protein PHYSODRAFT_299880 [Phytophthora sojae]|eukprot:XP_009525450.1 hypothetical protein PHYSODRAFT_299880 [Phytophthora sojae]
MDPVVFTTLNDDELLQEALAVLDSFDSGELDVLTPFIVEEDAADDNLLKAALDVLEDPVSAMPVQGQETESKPHPHGSPQSVSSPHSADVVEKVTPSGRGRGQGRVRLREQLIQLRSVVRQMEAHLESLKSPTSPRFNSCADPRQGETEPVTADESSCSQTWSLDAAGDGDSRTTAWRAVAMQEFFGRRKAEQQNAQLRENLATQIRLSKQLRTLLQSQPHSGFSQGDLTKDHQRFDKIKLPPTSIALEEELMGETLAILDSVGFQRLEAQAPDSQLSGEAAAIYLLNTAIQGVHEARATAN